MKKSNLNRVAFDSVHDMLNTRHLINAEKILKSDINQNPDDINGILELYHIKLFLDHELYLNNWSDEDVASFTSTIKDYSNLVGRLISTISDENFNILYNQLEEQYIESFWELINNQKAYKDISYEKVNQVLKEEPHVIRTLLNNEKLINYYGKTIREYLLSYQFSAEIILSKYLEKKDFLSKLIYLPNCLSIDDKKKIISNYIELKDANLNYLQLIPNAKDNKDFKLDRKIKLKAKKRCKKITDFIFSNDKNSMPFGVEVSFTKKTDQLLEIEKENQTIIYKYSYDYIEKNSNSFSLFKNFQSLFFFLDNQRRIELVSRENDLNVFEITTGVKSNDEYTLGFAFTQSEMTSLVQITSYKYLVKDFNTSLEEILRDVFTIDFHEKYKFDKNAKFSIPPKDTSYFEKLRFILFEFESILKQYTLFVEEAEIDEEAIDIMEESSDIKNIPSLNKNKYFYLNEDNEDVKIYIKIIFSNQTLLGYVEKFKEKHYQNFFDLVIDENVLLDDFEVYQKHKIDYLIDKEIIFIDKNQFIQFTNLERVCILKDLNENEVASFHHYPKVFQAEAEEMKKLNMIYFEDTLLSKPEQDYFNYYLKSNFSNGLKLRNKYAHANRINPDKTKEHENAYTHYLKILILTLLKIEDDLKIWNISTKLKSD